MKESWLQNIRSRCNMTQNDVARAVKMSRAAYANIERGVRRPSPELAQKLGKLLDFDWTRFFEAGDEPGDKTA